MDGTQAVHLLLKVSLKVTSLVRLLIESPPLSVSNAHCALQSQASAGMGGPAGAFTRGTQKSYETKKHPGQGGGTLLWGLTLF